MQTTPSKSKRSLTFQSPSQSPSSKREIQIGYILDVTSILKKGSYYCIQFQNEENNAESLIVYNCKIHQSLQHFEGSGDPVKLQVLRQNDTLKVGSFCHVYQAFPSDVAFPLNSSLNVIFYCFLIFLFLLFHSFLIFLSFFFLFLFSLVPFILFSYFFFINRGST